MPDPPTREALIETVRAALEASPSVQATWLEGADALGHADAFSDIDVWADVSVGAAQDVFSLIRLALESWGPLDLEEDAIHPHPQIEQRFFHVAGTPPYWFLDVCLQESGREVAFGPHDAFTVLFDRAEVLRRASAQPFDLNEAVRLLERRWWRRVLVEKELQRGHTLEALASYRGEVLAPLTELLRLRFCPHKRGYGLKHAKRDFPAEVLTVLEDLYAVHRLDQLPAALLQAEALFEETLYAVR